jgi:hypothetical protein
MYPRHRSLAGNGFGLNPDIESHFTRQTPPTILLQNKDEDRNRVMPCSELPQE